MFPLNTSKRALDTLTADYGDDTRAYGRSLLESDIEVLQAIKEGDCHPALIMQRSKLSWRATVATLRSLMEAGTISLSIPKNYVLTKKGERILSNYASIKELLGDLLD